MSFLQPSNCTLIQGSIILPDPPKDTVSKLKFNDQGNLLAATSWDSGLYIYDINSNQIRLATKYNSTDPLLSCVWTQTNDGLFVSGCDNKVVLWKPNGNQSQQVAQHNSSIPYIFRVDSINCIATVSYDKSCCFWDLRQSTPAMTKNISFYPQACDIQDRIVMISDNDKSYLFDINSIQNSIPIQTYETTTTKCLTIRSDKNGFACGTYDGHVITDKFSQNSFPDKTLTFRCHHRWDGMAPRCETYALNDLKFHPTNPSLLITCGDNKCINFWDIRTHQVVLQEYKLKQAEVNCLEIDNNGKALAYSLGYSWYKGRSGVTNNNHVHIEMAPFPQVVL